MSCTYLYIAIAKHISTIDSSQPNGEAIQNIPFTWYSQLLSEIFTFALAPDGDGVFLVNYYIFVCVSMEELVN